MIEKEQPFVSPTEELDHILVEQLHSTKRQLKIVKRHLRLMPTDPWLNTGVGKIQNRMQFFENMIENKELIKKKKKKKKDRNQDILTRSPIYTLYRDAMIVTNIGYRFFADIAQSYISLYTKKKEKE
jgi:hypothetical protein